MGFNFKEFNSSKICKMDSGNWNTTTRFLILKVEYKDFWSGQRGQIYMILLIDQWWNWYFIMDILPIITLTCLQKKVTVMQNSITDDNKHSICSQAHQELSVLLTIDYECVKWHIYNQYSAIFGKCPVHMFANTMHFISISKRILKYVTETGKSHFLHISFNLTDIIIQATYLFICPILRGAL
jgi:hypothetical protein